LYRYKSGTIWNTSQSVILMATSKSRAWFFTWNNYPKDGLEQLCRYFETEKVEYIFQEERGDKGTPHLQGVIRYKNPRASAPMTACSGKAHWERCRSWTKAKKYCSKLETRVGRVYHNLKDFTYRRTIKDPLNGKIPYTWQAEVLELIMGNPDDRLI